MALEDVLCKYSAGLRECPSHVIVHQSRHQGSRMFSVLNGLHRSVSVRACLFSDSEVYPLMEGFRVGRHSSSAALQAMHKGLVAAFHSLQRGTPDYGSFSYRPCALCLSLSCSIQPFSLHIVCADDPSVRLYHTLLQSPKNQPAPNLPLKQLLYECSQNGAMVLQATSTEPSVTAQYASADYSDSVNSSLSADDPQSSSVSAVGGGLFGSLFRRSVRALGLSTEPDGTMATFGAVTSSTGGNGDWDEESQGSSASALCSTTESAAFSAPSHVALQPLFHPSCVAFLRWAARDMSWYTFTGVLLPTEGVCYISSSPSSLEVVLPGIRRHVCKLSLRSPSDLLSTLSDADPLSSHAGQVLAFPWAQVWLNGVEVPPSCPRDVYDGDILVIGSIRHTFNVRRINKTQVMVQPSVPPPCSCLLEDSDHDDRSLRKAADQILMVSDDSSTNTPYHPTIGKESHLKAWYPSDMKGMSTDPILRMLLEEVKGWFRWFGLRARLHATLTLTKATTEAPTTPRKRRSNEGRSDVVTLILCVATDHILYKPVESSVEKVLMQHSCALSISSVTSLVHRLCEFGTKISEVLYDIAASFHNVDAEAVLAVQSMEHHVASLEYKGLCDIVEAPIPALITRLLTSVESSSVSVEKIDISGDCMWVDHVVKALVDHDLVPVYAMGWGKEHDGRPLTELLKEDLIDLWRPVWAAHNREVVIELTIHCCLLLRLSQDCFGQTAKTGPTPRFGALFHWLYQSCCTQTDDTI
mmetsp:Transcript_7773/g.11557  ORF Transcript_7773/g.11557 Transcript_7773/m.11557 type:complete len:753 (-) Transcript_7773:251-2509(-)